MPVATPADERTDAVASRALHQPFHMCARRPTVPVSMAIGCLAALLPLGLASCSAGDAPAPSAGSRPLVVVSIEPLAMILRELGGPGLGVHTLLPAGASPHTFEARPRDLRRVAGARWVLRVGGPFDAWAEPVFSVAAPEAKRGEILALPELDPLPIRHGHAHRGEPHTDETPDPHCWLDPLRVRDRIVPALLETLTTLDPQHRIQYRANATRFQVVLTALDRELREHFSRNAAPWVSLHPAWGYLADRYGLREIGVVETVPGEAPSPRALVELVRRARAAGVRRLVIEPQLPQSALRALADELDAVLIEGDPLGDPSSPERADYAALLRYNARVLTGVASDRAPEPGGRAVE